MQYLITSKSSYLYPELWFVGSDF